MVVIYIEPEIHVDYPDLMFVKIFGVIQESTIVYGLTSSPYSREQKLFAKPGHGSG